MACCIFKVLKGKNFQPRIFLPGRVTIQIEGEIKSFLDKQKLMEFITTKLFLQEMLKRLLYSEKKCMKILTISPPRSQFKLSSPLTWKNEISFFSFSFLQLLLSIVDFPQQPHWIFKSINLTKFSMFQLSSGFSPPLAALTYTLKNTVQRVTMV